MAKSELIILLKGQLNKIEVFLKFAMYVYLPWWKTATVPASAFQPVSLLLDLAFDTETANIMPCVRTSNQFSTDQINVVALFSTGLTVDS